MKKFRYLATLMAAAVMAGVLAVPAPLLAADLKVGAVNMRRLYTDFYKTKIARNTLEESVAAYRKDYQQRVEDYNKLNDEFQKLREESSSPALTQEKRDQKTKAAQDKSVELRKSMQAIQEFERSSQQFLSDQERRQNDAIIKDILEVVRKKCQSSGYTLVFDTSGFGSGNLPSAVYADEKLDFSDLVLKDLNANAPANLPASKAGTSAPSLPGPSSSPKTPAPLPPPAK